MSAWFPMLDIAALPFLEKNMMVAMLACKAGNKAEKKWLSAAWKFQVVSQTRLVLALETIALLRVWVQAQDSLLQSLSFSAESPYAILDPEREPSHGQQDQWRSQ